MSTVVVIISILKNYSTGVIYLENKVLSLFRSSIYPDMIGTSEKDNRRGWIIGYFGGIWISRPSKILNYRIFLKFFCKFVSQQNNFKVYPGGSFDPVSTFQEIFTKSGYLDILDIPL
jgi:hypothetical protein